MKTQFTIYQVNATNENSRCVKFSSLETIKRMHLFLSIDIYNKVYESEIETDSDKVEDVLDEIYHVFNVRIPNDFKGHSLSVSDVVLMNGSYYFCDSYGWAKVAL